jgi:hypothetical protein
MCLDINIDFLEEMLKYIDFFDILHIIDILPEIENLLRYINFYEDDDSSCLFINGIQQFYLKQ